MLKIGALVSGNGTNLGAIINSIENGDIENAELSIVVSNKENAYALERARKHNIKSMFLNPKNFKTKEDYDLELVKIFNKENVELIILAGYMKILTSSFINSFPNKILNIHPSLIPSFSGEGYYGLKVHEAALARGVKITGATVHYVTEETDEGPIMLQKAVNVLDCDTPEILQRRVLEEAEWKIYPEAINIIAKEKSLKKKN